MTLPMRNSASQWGAVSIALHWLSFALVLGMAIAGLLMVEMDTSPLKVRVYALHKSFGLTVLGLTALRLLWRLASRVPEPVPGTPGWQNLSARLTHSALYALLLAVPLSGWWYNSASGFSLRWFGLFKLPALTAYDRELKALALDTHETLFYVLAALVLLHSAAALWHHYRLRDVTLTRMLPIPPSPRDPSP